MLQQLEGCEHGLPFELNGSVEKPGSSEKPVIFF